MTTSVKLLGFLYNIEYIFKSFFSFLEIQKSIFLPLAAIYKANINLC